MTTERMIELLEIEHECMLRGAHNDCDRNCADCELVQDDDELHEMYTNVIALMKERRWIPVTERLPEVGQVVLALGARSSTTGMFQGITSEKHPDMWWWKHHTTKYVSHWMPLPAAPNKNK